MKPHIKLYLEHFGYIKPDSRIVYNSFSDIAVTCELCGNISKNMDIHHISARGQGGTSKPEDIKNIMALCRNCHTEYGDKKQYLQMLKDKHYEILDITEKLNLLT
jgi:5-methylcytosine-specific restriction endonuclease McrA